MKMCKVLGTIVATVKHEAYQGHKIMVVQPIDSQKKPSGKSFVAVDSVQAGKGDTVLVLTEGNGVRQILHQKEIPIRSIIVGIIDEIQTNDVVMPR